MLRCMSAGARIWPGHLQCHFQAWGHGISSCGCGAGRSRHVPGVCACVCVCMCVHVCTCGYVPGVLPVQDICGGKEILERQALMFCC